MLPEGKWWGLLTCNRGAAGVSGEDKCCCNERGFSSTESPEPFAALCSPVAKDEGYILEADRISEHMIDNFLDHMREAVVKSDKDTQRGPAVSENASPQTSHGRAS